MLVSLENTYISQNKKHMYVTMLIGHNFKQEINTECEEKLSLEINTI